MKNPFKIILFTLALCAGLLILSACAPTVSQQGSEADLTASVWGLSTLNDQPLVPGTSISAQFTSDGKIGGSAGCNQYNGTYTTSGNKLQVAAPLATTMMACPQEIMDQETTYLAALGEVKTYSITADQLTLSDGNKKNIMVFTAQSQDLAGTYWEVLSYNNGKQAVVSVLAGTSITAQFGTDGTLSGNSGCNTYNGTFTATGRMITVGPLASTRMACGDPAGVMDQETQFLAALQSAATYKIEGTTLELRTSDGALAVQATASTPVQPTQPESEQPIPVEPYTILDIVWQWVSVTDQSTGAVTAVSNPENYTITFNADGTLTGKADCNNFSGTYSQEGGFTISLGASTMAYCGDASLDQQFLTLLSSIAAGGPDGAGGLALETAGGAQRMLFQNGGTPTTSEPTDTIQGIVWQWVSVTDQSTGQTTTVPHPNKYTITFNADGTLTGTADCNTFSGTYSQEGGFVITLGASTLVACGENSLDQQYLVLLNSVVAGGPDGAGGLALENAGGQQRMLFQNGGAATE